jgi:hypothetical protein
LGKLRILIQINHQPYATAFQFIFWRLFTAERISGVFPPIISRASWPASRPDHEHSTTVITIRR